MFPPSLRVVAAVAWSLFLAVTLAACDNDCPCDAGSSDAGSNDAGSNDAGSSDAGPDAIDSDEQARRAYLGFEKSVGKMLLLGFGGFNEASHMSRTSFPTRYSPGEATGSVLVGGDVMDFDSSGSKDLVLDVTMSGYSDGDIAVSEDGELVNITYGSATRLGSPSEFKLRLHDIPNGSFSGTFLGAFLMTGDQEGVFTVYLTVSGEIEDTGNGDIRRKAGTTVLTGTASVGKGTYDIMVWF